MSSSALESTQSKDRGKDSEGLRHVEKDVLIPKKMRAKAMTLCQGLVKEFEDCIRGRTVSAVWHCRAENTKMQECLAKYHFVKGLTSFYSCSYKNEEFYEQCKKEYLEERQKFEETGEKQNMRRASS